MAEEQANTQDPEAGIAAANESIDGILSRVQELTGTITEAEERLEAVAQTVSSIGDGLEDMKIAALNVTGLADMIPGMDDMLPMDTPLGDAIAAAAAADGEEPVYLQLTTPFGEGVLQLQRITGEESISQLFQYHLQMTSDESDLDFSAIVGKQVTASIMLADGTKRHINGYVARFAHAGSTLDHTYYFAEVVPWYWILTLTQNSRIFQEKSVIDIITQIFDEFDFAEYRNATKATYKPREYCVQYRESAFNFCSRLMEDEGIFYYFEHTEDKHTLVLADDTSVHENCAGLDKARFAPSRRSGN